MITEEYQHAVEERKGYNIWTGKVTTLQWAISKAGAESQISTIHSCLLTHTNRTEIFESFPPIKQLEQIMNTRTLRYSNTFHSF
jgi:hypothetical protein